MLLGWFEFLFGFPFSLLESVTSGSIPMVLDGAISTLTRPERHQGLLESLDGLVAGVVVDTTGTAEAGSSFNPSGLAYSGNELFSILTEPEGVGHKVLDSGSGGYALIRGHPFISVYSSLGRHSRLASFTEYGNRLIVTVGGRPVYVQT